MSMSSLNEFKMSEETASEVERNIDVEPEIWLPIVSYEHYEVSCLGRVRCNINIPVNFYARAIYPGKLLKPEFNKGYHRVHLYKNKKSRGFLVHCLVANAFIGAKPSSEYEVNHKNCDKLDNRSSNLEWVTRQENIDHAILNGKRFDNRGSRHWRSKLNEQSVVQMRDMYANGSSVEDLMKAFGVTQGAVWCVINRLTWKHV